MKQIHLKQTIAVSLIISTLFAGSLTAQPVDPRTTFQKFNAAFQLINMAYVDSVNQPKLIEKAIIEMLMELDPHSVYLSKAEIDRANEPLVGNFEGIGVQFQIFKDTIVVTTVIAGGPSEKVGIIAGDKIMKIEGENAFGPKINNDFVLNRLRGRKDTKVNISIFRQGNPKLLEFTITRDKIPINSIDATFMAAPETGYIRLNRFSRTSMLEFRESIAKLRQKGMQHLILDLRGNSGGFLDVAVDLADEFLGADKMIVYTRGMRSPRQDFRATSQGSFQDGRLIVLINEGSASASEIVAGAVQDWDRGVVMGRRSFGKGLVQRPFTLPDSSVIRLTTARYYTPAGRSIQKPYSEGVAEYQNDFRRRIEHGEMFYADSIRFPDSLKYLTHNKRVVYGGGGIMPDIFLPVDTTSNSNYYNSLVRRGVFNSFTMDYMNSNRTRLEKNFSTPESVLENFEVDDALFQSFLAYAEKEGVKKEERGLATSANDMRVLLKAYIARSLFDLNTYYRVVLDIDKDLSRALSTMQNKAVFDKILFKK